MDRIRPPANIDMKVRDLSRTWKRWREELTLYIDLAMAKKEDQIRTVNPGADEELKGLRGEVAKLQNNLTLTASWYRKKLGDMTKDIRAAKECREHPNNDIGKRHTQITKPYGKADWERNRQAFG